jgi:hypothetical protein
MIITSLELFQDILITLDVEYASEFITRTEAIDPTLASALWQRVDELDFSTLLKLSNKNDEMAR